MRTKHLAGKEALRVEVFMPDMNPADERRARKYIGTQFDLSLIFRHNGIHEMPGPDVEHRVCYQLYMHDEVTPGGILVADSCQLPEYYLDAVTSDPIEETITLTMNNGYEFVVDLTEMLSKYDTMIRRNVGQGTMTFEKGGIDIITWTEGSTYTLDSLSNSLTIHSADGNDYVISMTAWDFDYDAGSSTFTISKDGVQYLQFLVGSLVTFTDNGDGDYTITVNGTATSFNTGVANIEEVSTNSFVATLADGSTVGWTAEHYESGFLYLFNPIIYIRPTGTASPPITKQADMTLANAFDSFASARAFLANSLISGTVYYDIEGSLNSITTITVDDLHGADFAEFYGADDDPDNFVIYWGNGSSNFSDGIRFSGNFTARIRDCKFVCAGARAGSRALVSSNGATVEIGGVLKFEGTIYDSQGIFKTSSTLNTYEPHGNAPAVEIVLDVVGTMSMFINNISGGSFTLSNFKISRNEMTAVTVTAGVIYALDMSLTTLRQAVTLPYEPNCEAAGTYLFDGPVFNLGTTSSVHFMRVSGVAFPNTNIAAFFLNADTSSFTIDKTSSVTVGNSVRYGTTSTDYV